MLSKAVTKTPHGIGLGIPETMQLAIDEAGAPRIVAAAAVSAAGKVVGKRGLFYKVAGADVEAIDGPTWNTLPPHNTHAKLGPADPDGVAAHLADVLSDAAGGRVEFVVIDANDLTATVLGASPSADRALAKRLMRDNPLGQGHEQTPVCVLRPLGPLLPADPVLTSADAHASRSPRPAAMLVDSPEPGEAACSSLAPYSGCDKTGSAGLLRRVGRARRQRPWTLRVSDRGRPPVGLRGGPIRSRPVLVPLRTSRRRRLVRLSRAGARTEAVRPTPGATDSSSWPGYSPTVRDPARSLS